MAGYAEGVEILLRLRGERAVLAGTRAAAEGFRELGASAARAGEQSAVASGKMGRASGVMAIARKGALGLGLGLAGTAVEAVKLGVEFDKQMTLIQTQAGASGGEVRKMHGAILGMAAGVNQGPVQLAKALYNIESVGYRGAAALKMLRAAANGAAMGNTSVEETSATLAGVLKTRMPGAAKTAQGAMAQLTAIVGSGKMHLEDLNLALGTGILPAAKRYGLTLKDIGGALAIFTDEHMQGSSAMAQLGTALHFLVPSGKKALAAFDQIHLGQFQLAHDMRDPRKGLLGALRDLQTHIKTLPGADAQLAAMNAILPGGRGRIIGTLMNQLDAYSGKMRQQDKIAKNYTHNLWLYHQSASYKIGSAWNGVTAALVKLGTVLKGPATTALTFLMHAGAKLIGVFAGLVSGSGKTGRGVSRDFRGIWTVAKEMGKVVGTVLRTLGGPVFRTFVGGAKNMLYGIATAFTGLWRMVKGVANIIAGIFTLDFGRAWGGLKQLFSGGVKFIVGVFLAATGPIRAAAVTVWNGLKSGLQAVIDWIVGKLNSIIQVWNDTAGRLLGSIGLISTASTQAAASVQAAGKGLTTFQNAAPGNRRVGVGGTHDLPHGGGRVHRAMGGVIRPHEVTTLGERGRETVFLPQGARVIPHDEAMQALGEPRGRGGGKLELHVHHYVNGREVLHSIDKRELAGYVDSAIEHVKASV